MRRQSINIIGQEVFATTFMQLYKCLHNHSLEALVGLLNIRQLGAYWMYSSSVSYTKTRAPPSSGIGNSLRLYPVSPPRLYINYYLATHIDMHMYLSQTFKCTTQFWNSGVNLSVCCQQLGIA